MHPKREGENILNTTNNRHSQLSRELIQNAFLALLKEQDLKKISVRSICEKAGVNRTTFYKYYLDVYDLLDKMEANLSAELKAIFQKRLESREEINDIFCELFRFVLRHQDFYRAYLAGHVSFGALNLLTQEPLSSSIDRASRHLDFYSSNGVNYHLAFFTAGVGEITRLWLNNGCAESPEEMADIIRREYHTTQRL